MTRESYIPLIRLKVIKGIPYFEERLHRTEDVATEIVSNGSLDFAPAIPREVFRHAVLCNARGVLMVHNHILRDCEPSENDLSITRRIQKAGEILG